MTEFTYYNPNPAEKRLIEALRSGKYKQTIKALERDGKNCCLGVACRVSSVDLEIGVYVNFDGTMSTLFNSHNLDLPDEVKNELEWSESIGELEICGRDEVETYLADLNDSGFTFNQIADIIEAGLVVHDKYRHSVVNDY